MEKFPRAIVHVDGDAFFVGCELAAKPKLRGLPVVTGHERGIATAVSYEAKALGVTRTSPIYMIRKLFPQVIVLNSNYANYRRYSDRMASILRRYTPLVEHYSVDECFADITSPNRNHLSYEDTAHKIKFDLELELGMTFSVGLSVNKVLAKVASKHRKPSGLVSIPKPQVAEFLRDLPVGKIWGIGHSTAIKLQKRGMSTALLFARKPFGYIKDSFAKPQMEIWRELNGEYVFVLETGTHQIQSSVSRTRSFKPPSSTRDVVFAELSQNVEDACFALRQQGLYARKGSCFLKTKDFRYKNLELSFLRPLAVPELVLREIDRRFDHLFDNRERYRATGITFFDLYPGNRGTLDLFGAEKETESFERLYESVDEMSERFGEGSIFLASSMNGVRKLPRPKTIFERLEMPFLGKVH